MSSKADFDFLIGDWEVKNKKLKERLIGSDEWIEFKAHLSGSKKFLNDLALMDHFVYHTKDGLFEGVSLRIFDPKSAKWAIYWFDSDHPEITEQVVGKFENNIGTFYGIENFNCKTVKLRVIWFNITSTSAKWEQAYFDGNQNQWETNWIMDFAKIII